MTHGRLIAICGPMFSGKSTELIRRVQAEGADVLPKPRRVFLKPARDVRYGAGQVVTHGGIRADAIPVDRASEITDHAATAAIVGIDEAHFFGGELTATCVSLVEGGKVVVVAGLERDHRGAPFEPFPALLCEADEVIKLSCPCTLCGRPAVHSQRMVADPGRIVVGGAESYQPRCRACFKPGA